MSEGRNTEILPAVLLIPGGPLLGCKSFWPELGFWVFCFLSLSCEVQAAIQPG